VKKISRFSLILLLLIVGIGFIAYPSLANYYNERHSSAIIDNYKEEIKEIDKNEFIEYLSEAYAYNQRLSNENIENNKLPEEYIEEYERLLNINNDGIMGYLLIEKVDLCLPIYHWSDKDSLANGLGHVEYSSLPVGGDSCHSVLAGHSGLRDKSYFNVLFDLDIGDCFVINVLDQQLIYEIDSITEVLPNDLSSTRIIEGQDYCTLLTCSPIGVNSHRLLVRGKRVKEDSKDNFLIIRNEIKILNVDYVGLAYSAIIYILYLLIIFLKGRIRGQ